MATTTVIIMTLLIGAATIGFGLFYGFKYRKKNSYISIPAEIDRPYLIKKNKVVAGSCFALMQVMIFITAFIKFDIPSVFLIIIRISIPTLFVLLIFRSLIIIRWLKSIPKEGDSTDASQT